MEPLDQQQQLIAQALSNLPLTVFNSFVNSHTSTEIHAVLQYGPRVTGVLVMAPSVAKSFGLALLEIVQKYEQHSGLDVPTVAEINDRFEARAATAGNPLVAPIVRN